MEEDKFPIGVSESGLHIRTEKMCSRCREIKPLPDFVIANREKDKRSCYCRSCWNEKAKEQYLIHSEDIKARTKKWRMKNPEKTKKSEKEWRKEHEEQVKKNAKEWQRTHTARIKEYHKKSYNTPRGKLNDSIRGGINQSIKQGLKNGRRWETLVDFTVEQLKRHLERLFKPGMNWDNQGALWEIDHKIPIVCFNFKKPGDIDFKKCWSLTNLQPMLVKQNRIKGARISEPFQPSLLLQHNLGSVQVG